MVGFILISNYIINRRLVNRLWKPFYTTIEQIKKYQLALQAPLKLSSEKIDEIKISFEGLLLRDDVKICISEEINLINNCGYKFKKLG